MKKKILSLLMLVGALTILTGCGAKEFTMNVDGLTQFAESNGSELLDVTDDYSEGGYVEKYYIVKANGIQIEVVDLSSEANASTMFNNYTQMLDERDSAHAGSSTKNSADYSYTVDGVYHRLLLYKDLIAYGFGEDKDAVVSEMKTLGYIS